MQKLEHFSLYKELDEHQKYYLRQEIKSGEYLSAGELVKRAKNKAAAQRVYLFLNDLSLYLFTFLILIIIIILIMY